MGRQSLKNLHANPHTHLRALPELARAFLGMLASATLVLAACNPTGPRSIHGGRALYNEAIAATSSEQLLLNLVRLRYRDTPVFLEVTSVSTSFTLENSLGINGQAGLNTVADDFAGASAGISFAERPTITYLPLQGEQFATRMLTPLRPRVLVLLANSGWAIDRVLLIGVQRLGPLVNAPSASGPTPSLAPQYEDFLELVRALRTLQREHELSLTLVSQGPAPGDGMGHVGGEDLLGITLPASVKDTTEYATVLELLDIDGASTNPDGSLTIVCSLRSGAVGADASGPGGPLPLVTRSLMSSMFFLSHAVAVGEQDEQAGIVTTTRTRDGERFDWNDLLVNTFRVQTSNERPTGAQTAIRHRGRWFWVDDADLTSKSTMGLMQQLFALQAGDIRGGGPILTLPLSGN
ncbi:MAG: hypothetical protein ACIAS6_07400 [Phycisphaerales bacterium JB060]